MLKKITTNLLIMIVASTLSSAVTSQEVDLNINIEGQGRVSVVGTDLNCTENCTLKVDISDEQPVVLEHQGTNGALFHRWLSDSCDSGEGVMINEYPTHLQSIQGGAKTLILEDFNADGLADASMIGLFSGKVSIALNSENDRFNQVNNIAAGLSYPSAMESIDWDADGDRDLLVVAYASSEIFVYFNDGKAQFEHGQTIKIDNLKPYAIAVEDINGDGRLDLLLSSFDANIKGDLTTLVDSIKNTDLSWFTQNENGSFDHYQTLSTTEGVITLDVADIDNDGDIDAVAASITGEQAIVYWNEGKTVNQQIIVENSGVYSVALGDVDNNGLQDLLIAFSWDPKLILSLQLSERNFSDAKLIKNFEQTEVTATALADIDADGKLDVGTATFGENNFYWLKNDSFDRCVITGDRSRRVTAVFKSEQQQQADAIQVQKNLVAAQKKKINELEKSLVAIELEEARKWLSFMDAGDYEQSCNLAGPIDLSKDDKHACKKMFEGLVSQLGKTISRRFIGTEYVSKPPGSNGELAVVFYEASFEKLSNGQPIIIKLTMKKMQGLWRMVGYRPG